MTPIGSNDDYGYKIVVQNDGKIVVAGYSQDGPHTKLAIVRYNEDGILDTGFNGNGKVTTGFGTGTDDAGLGMALQSNGEIVVAGYSGDGGGFAYDFAVASYNSDGTLDTSFGAGGKVTTDFGVGPDIAQSVAL